MLCFVTIRCEGVSLSDQQLLCVHSDYLRAKIPVAVVYVGQSNGPRKGYFRALRFPYYIVSVKNYISASSQE